MDHNVCVVGPSVVCVYLLALYGRTHLQFRRMAKLTADAVTDELTVSNGLGALLTTKAANRLTFALDVRLLSYLLAYIVCELPALPIAFVDLKQMSSNDVATYDDEFTFLLAMRMLLPPLQGVANALAYIHHARPCKRARWLYRTAVDVAAADDDDEGNANGGA